jgi:uncharacterized protein
MMKKILAAGLIALVLAFTIQPLAHAADIDLVTDEVGILTGDQRAELNQRAEQISQAYDCEVAILVIQDLPNPSARQSAEDLYHHYNYGYGTQRSGLLLMLAMAERDYALVAYGYGNTAFTDHGKDVMLDSYILPQLGRNSYYQALDTYLDKAEEYLRMAREGRPFDIYPEPSDTTAIRLGITIGAPLLISFIMVMVWKARMKTAKIAKQADRYVADGGLQLTMREDNFTHRTQTTRVIDTDSSSSSSARSSGGGGTTVSSSGFSGRSGKF